jgi:hypothetical protein
MFSRIRFSCSLAAWLGPWLLITLEAANRNNYQDREFRQAEGQQAEGQQVEGQQVEDHQAQD